MAGDETDRRLEERAVIKGWPLTDSHRAKVLQRVLNQLDRDHEDGEKAKPRQVLAAAKVVVAIDRLILDREKLDRLNNGSGDDLATMVEDAERMAESYTPDEAPADG